MRVLFVWRDFHLYLCQLQLNLFTYIHGNPGHNAYVWNIPLGELIVWLPARHGARILF